MIEHLGLLWKPGSYTEEVHQSRVSLGGDNRCRFSMIFGLISGDSKCNLHFDVFFRDGIYNSDFCGPACSQSHVIVFESWRAVCIFCCLLFFSPPVLEVFVLRSLWSGAFRNCLTNFSLDSLFWDFQIFGVSNMGSCWFRSPLLSDSIYTYINIHMHVSYNLLECISHIHHQGNLSPGFAFTSNPHLK